MRMNLFGSNLIFGVPLNIFLCYITIMECAAATKKELKSRAHGTLHLLSFLSPLTRFYLLDGKAA